MILRLLCLAVLPGVIGYQLYPRLQARGMAFVLAFGAAAALAAFSAATVTFWWLPEGAEAPTLSRLAVACGISALAGVLAMAGFVGLFGGADPVTPRPLHRIIATAATTVSAYLLSEWVIDIQRGLG